MVQLIAEMVITYNRLQKDFNSTMVQLIANTTTSPRNCDLYFNSTMVQLIEITNMLRDCFNCYISILLWFN